MIEMLNDEKERLIRELNDSDPGTKEYGDLEAHLETLQRVYRTEMELNLNADRQARELNLTEVKAKVEASLKEEEARLKRKDSWRGVWKVFLAGIFSIGQVILIANYEEIRPLFGKAWGFISKPKL